MNRSAVLEIMAEGVVELIVKRSVDTFLAVAATEGIRAEDIPEQYLNAIETGAATGVAQTMLMLRELGWLNLNGTS